MRRFPLSAFAHPGFADKKRLLEFPYYAGLGKRNANGKHLLSSFLVCMTKLAHLRQDCVPVAPAMSVGVCCCLAIGLLSDGCNVLKGVRLWFVVSFFPHQAWFNSNILAQPLKARQAEKLSKAGPHFEQFCL